MLRFFSRLLRPRWFRLALLLVAVAFLVFPFIVIEWGRSHVYLPDSTIPPHDVAIVFGASVRRDGSPSIMLRDRLIKAADLYRDQVVQKILVSGHNAKDGYNEPEGMYQYLISKEMIPADDVVRDYAGRRTYDTCIRAQQIWRVQEAMLITQGYHLTRALYTCTVLGIDSSGLAANRQEYQGIVYFKFREILAIYQALIDLYVWSPAYVGGEVEDDLR